MGTIKLENLTIKFNEVLLDNVSYEFKNKNYLIQGKNGCGKTTLVKAMTKNIDIYSGKIHRFETTISYFPQEVLLFHYLKVKEFFSCINKAIDSSLLDLLEIDYLDEYIKNLSTGQVNKILIYLTFSQEADFYIIDEIINAIDNNVKTKIVKYLAELTSGNFILITHDKSLSDLIKENIKIENIEISNKTFVS